MQQLLYNRLLSKTEDQYGILKLNENSWKILKGELPVTLILKKEKIAITEEEEVPEYDRDLFKELKSIRLDLAEREYVPAYAIVSDNTITELATYLPQTFDELKHISGFGDYKVSKYGAHFIKPIKQFAEKNNLQSRVHLKAPKRERKQRPEKTTTNTTQHTTLSLYKDGMTIVEIAAKRNLTSSTIESHLAAFIGTGELNISKFMSLQKLNKIIEVIKATGQTVAAKPIKDLLTDDYSYGEIKMALEYFKNTNHS